MTTNGWNVYSAKSVGDGVFQQSKVQVGGFESLYHFAVRKTKLINLVFRYRKYIFVPIEENDVIGIVCLPLSFKILLLFASSLKMLLLWVLLLEGVMPSTLALPLSPLTFLLSVQASKQANERTNKRYCTKFIHGPARRWPKFFWTLHPFSKVQDFCSSFYRIFSHSFGHKITPRL